MKAETVVSHVTPADSNIFAELGFGEDEAKQLLAESNRIVAEKLAIKEKLMAEVSTWIDEKSLKQEEAAAILGVTRPRVSDVRRKKVNKFSIDSLIDMLARTGKHVTVKVA